MDKNKQSKITPLGLKSMARSIARSYGEPGAIVMVAGGETIRIGTWGLDDREIQDALCLGIHHNMIRICGELEFEEQGG